MPEFGDLPLAILRSISAASGEDYRDIDEPQLREELTLRGCEPNYAALDGAMRQLKDAGYLYCTFLGGGGGAAVIRLVEKGRQQVENWPTAPGALSAADVQELISSLELRGNDATLAPDERTKARAAASALKDMGLSVTGGLVTAWLRHLGVP